MKKRAIKKLVLNKESILRLDSSKLGEVIGGATRLCTNTDFCTDSCGACTGNTCLC